MWWFGKKQREQGQGRKPSSGDAISFAAPDTQLAAGKDRVVRVFVSSTFRDMVEDRNELMSQVWPALRKLCRSRAVEFVEVDLRWGVPEEQSRRKETLRHCLAEIKRCRPYFIGILGERYGWIPGSDAYSEALLDEESWLKNEVSRRSVTELEIMHGVLKDPDMAPRSFFYFRDPSYAQSRGSDYLSEDAESAGRQATLKTEVEAVCRQKNTPLRMDYADPRALAALALADLTAAIDAEYPPDQVPDVWTREDRDHEAFARSRSTKFYVGRDAYYDRLDVHAKDGAGGCGLVVLGESGGGKSALLANWVMCRRRTSPNDFIFQHYIGSSPMSASHLGLMRRLMVAIIRWCRAGGTQAGIGSEEERIPAKADEIVKAFPDYLNRLAAEARRRGVRAVVVLDALNQLEDREHGRLLAWLPRRMPGDLRLVVSTLPGDTLDALQPGGWPELRVEPLTAGERVQFIARYLEHFSQGLSEVRAAKIAENPASANPLFLKTLLDDLRVIGAHSKLDEQIDDYLKATDIPALLGKVLARYERAYERDRPGLVREALSLLWAARRGLTEPELLEVLKTEGQERLPAAFWSPVRYALEDGLVDRDGVLAFAHEHLRKAVERRYVPDAGSAKALRLRLADDFAARPVDARQADELPWLLRQAEARNRLRACLLNVSRFLLILARDDDEVRSYWVWLQEERTMGKTYLAIFEPWSRQPGRDDRSIARAASGLAYFLDSCALHAEAEPLCRRALAIHEQSHGRDHPDVARDLNNLARLLQDTNRLAEAEPLYRRALAIWEQSLGRDHPNVATARTNLAGLLRATNRLAEAESLCRRALVIDERSFGKDHPAVARDLNELASFFQDTNRLAKAEPLYRRALAIWEQSLGRDHPNVATALNDLAELLKATNRPAEAEPLYRRALAIDEGSHGKDHPKVARDFSNLASLLQDTNRLAEAEPLYRRALAIWEQSLGRDHPNVATALNNLAGLLRTTNRLAEAEPLYRRALAILEQSLGRDHPNVAKALNNLAELLRTTNRLAEAEPLYRRALAILEQSFGRNHPNVASAIHNLALMLQATNRLAEAERLMRRALKIDEHSFGENHPNVAADLGTLASLLCTTDRPAEAEPLMRRALKIDEQSYGNDHPEAALDLNNLASLLRTTNRPAEAEPLLRRAVEIILRFRAATGHEHPNQRGFVDSYRALLSQMGRSAAEIRSTLEELGQRLGVDLSGLSEQTGTESSPALRSAVEELEGDPSKDEAEPHMRRALEVAEQSLGKNHPKVAACLNNLAQLLQDTDRLAEAEPLMRRALRIDEQSLGKNHPDVATCLNNLAQLLQVTNRPAEAEPLMRRALAIDEQSYGKDHPNVAIRLGNLAMLLCATDRFAEAEPLCRRALKIDEQSYGRDHPEVARDLNNLAQLLLATNGPAEAEPLYRRTVEILLQFTHATGHPHPHLQATVESYAGLLHSMGHSKKEARDSLKKLGLRFGVDLR